MVPPVINFRRILRLGLSYLSHPVILIRKPIRSSKNIRINPKFRSGGILGNFVFRSGHDGDSSSWSGTRFHWSGEKYWSSRWLRSDVSDHRRGQQWPQKGHGVGQMEEFGGLPPLPQVSQQIADISPALSAELLARWEIRHSLKECLDWTVSGALKISFIWYNIQISELSPIDAISKTCKDADRCFQNSQLDR